MKLWLDYQKSIVGASGAFTGSSFGDCGLGLGLGLDRKPIASDHMGVSDRLSR